MKKLIQFISVFALIICIYGCSNAHRSDINHQQRSIDNSVLQEFQLEILGINLILPASSIIKTAPVSSDAYKEGMRVSIDSLSSEEFIKKLHTPAINDYFDFVIYEPKKMQTADIDTLIKQRCEYRNGYADAQKINMSEYSIVVVPRSCHPLPTYLLVHGEDVFLIEEGQDTRNSKGILGALQAVKFLH